MKLEEILKAGRTLEKGEIVGKYLIKEAICAPKYGPAEEEYNSLIYRALNSSGEEVVLKGLNYYLLRKLSEEGKNEEIERRLDMFNRETRIWPHLQHPNIARCYPAIEHSGMHFLPVDYVSEGFDSILDYISLREFTLHLCDVIAYLQRKRIIHRDIKKENTRFDPKTGKIKLIDFGLARHMLENPNGQLYGFTKGYIAPETSSTEIHPTYDIFSLGTLIRKAWVSTEKRKTKMNQPKGDHDEEITAKGKVNAKGRKSTEIPIIGLTDYPNLCATIFACEFPAQDRDIQRIRRLAGKIEL